jgi:hypothetical protein
MNMVRRTLVAALTVAALLSSAVMAADADVTGKWIMTVNTPAGSGNPIFELKQEGEQVTGNYSGALGEAAVTGSVKGDELTIRIPVPIQGQNMTVIYIGKIEGDTVSGKVSLGDLGEGTFTGKKS